MTEPSKENLSNAELDSWFRDHVGQTSPFPNGLRVARAQGCVLTDTDGREYLDFISGIAVCNVGHCHPQVVQAVQEQAARYAHTMVYGEHVQEPQVRLAAKIAELAPPGLDAVYLLTTGAEANDAALKMACRATGRREVVACRRGYHGDTLGALACFGDDHFRQPFAHILRAATFIEFGNFEHLNRITQQTACVLMEPVQGEAGIVPPPAGYLNAVRQACTAAGAQLIFDEVQTGFGRVGAWFAAELYGVAPDIITVAKGLGAGYPLAGVIAARDALYRFAAEPPFSHITTFGGHPVSCAAALAGIAIIEEGNLLERARILGSVQRARAEAWRSEFTYVRAVRGVGLMSGIELDDAARSRRVIERCKASGLIVESNLMNEATIRLSPPLVLSDVENLQGLEILESCLRQES